MEQVRVTIYNEFIHERQPEIARVYPEGIHGCLRDALSDICQVRCATLEEPDHGLGGDVLAQTDVLIWWGHMAHERVRDDIAQAVVRRVHEGMGFICLHSGHMSKPFMALMGTSCDLKWRESDDHVRIWAVEPGHPIAAGLPDYFELEADETYGERFDIPAPDELVFASWFSGGEIFRSGCCFRRGMGRIFYFQPGHETYPIYYDATVRKVIQNAVQWARPNGNPPPAMGHYVPSPEARRGT